MDNDLIHLLTSDLEYCESTRNIDNMLIQFTKDRDKVISLLEDDPTQLVTTLWSPYSPVCNDKGCLFNMGKTMVHYTLEERINGKHIINEGVMNYYMCPQCKNMTRLMDFNKDKIGIPFYIEVGEYVGEQMVIVETKINNIYMIEESMPNTIKKILSSSAFKSIIKCNGNDDTKMKYDDTKMKYEKWNYLGSDPYTNNMLITWYIQKEFEKKGLQHIHYMNIAYVCSNDGFSLYEYVDISNVANIQNNAKYVIQKQASPTSKKDDVKPLNNDVVRGIVLSLFSSMVLLNEYDFSHGNPCSKSLMFKSEPVSYTYNNVNVDSPITLKLTNFKGSGLTIQNKIRLYSKSVIADETILRGSFRPIIKTVTFTPYVYKPRNNNNNNKNNNSKEERTERTESTESTTIYKLKNPDKHVSETILFMYIKHLGLPIYKSSFDIYAFMIVLMADKSFYTTLMNDAKLYKLWRNMWLDDFETIQDRILQLHEIDNSVDSVDKILRILSDISLRCDMVQYGWKLIKEYNL